MTGEQTISCQRPKEEQRGTEASKERRKKRSKRLERGTEENKW